MLETLAHLEGLGSNGIIDVAKGQSLGTYNGGNCLGVIVLGN